MAVPKRKHSTARKGKRRSVIKLKIPTLVSCPKCQKLKKIHLVCQYCGFYKKEESVK